MTDTSQKFQINNEFFFFLSVKRDTIVLEYKFSFHAIQMINISPELNLIPGFFPSKFEYFSTTWQHEHKDGFLKVTSFGKDKLRGIFGAFYLG